MSLQWEFLVGFLYFEILIVIILLVPFLSPQTWQKLFKSNIARKFNAGAKYYFNITILIFTVLFFDSLRTSLKHHETRKATEGAALHAHEHELMMTFRAQRNTYIAGFALFLWFVIKRLITLLSLCAHHMAESSAAQKQAKGAGQFAEQLMAEESKKKK